MSAEPLNYDWEPVAAAYKRERNEAEARAERAEAEVERLRKVAISLQNRVLDLRRERDELWDVLELPADPKPEGDA
jgi:chromosome segregation ATPase